ncbi:MAG: hypothetical protein A2Y33_06255 [Spirochaetes bacterium GWF1_51_8]|nr:MAG: hypothetical protein A2Y33_06255 [Spirochaetes bacterium GWF1_51_8]
MTLSLGVSELETIRGYLFQDGRERMILALCRKSLFGVFRLARLFLPHDSDYAERTEAAVTLLAESAYPLIKQLRADGSLSFLQIHSHPAGYPAKFSSIDDRNNGFNTEDVREWNPRAEFLRMVLSRDDISAEYYDYRGGRFRPLALGRVDKLILSLRGESRSNLY